MLDHWWILNGRSMVDSGYSKPVNCGNYFTSAQVLQNICTKFIWISTEQFNTIIISDDRCIKYVSKKIEPNVVLSTNKAWTPRNLKLCFSYFYLLKIDISKTIFENPINICHYQIQRCIPLYTEHIGMCLK